MNYLVLNIQAKNCNFLQSFSAFSPMAVMPIMMMVHALDKKMEAKGWPLEVESVGIVYQDAKPWIESMETKVGYLERCVVNQRGAMAFDAVMGKPNKAPQSNSIQPQIVGEMEWTVVIRHGQSIEGREAMVENVVSHMRLAGGSITQVKVLGITDNLTGALSSIRSGYWVDDVSSMLFDPEYKDMEPAEAFLRATRSGSWTLPANLGYALIDAPSKKNGVRDGKDHAFAETMLGLVKLTSLHGIRNAIVPEKFWKYGWVEDHFVVSNSDVFASAVV